MKNYKVDFRTLYENTNLSLYERDSEIDFVIEILTGKKPQYYYFDNELTMDEKQAVKKILQEHIETQKPLQYLVGRAFFAGKEYYVDENVLIPRPETEILVRKCIEKSPIKTPLILDIGTGSGCIAIELAIGLPHSNIVASDVCQNTLDIAKKNARKHSVLEQIDFVKSDLFENINGCFDIIVSNPPYISQNDVCEVQDDVYKYEPHRALFAKNDGMFFYNSIINSSVDFLKSGGLLLFEVGWKQADKVAFCMKEKGYTNIQMEKDLEGNNRIVFCEKY